MPLFSVASTALLWRPTAAGSPSACNAKRVAAKMAVPLKQRLQAMCCACCTATALWHLWSLPEAPDDPLVDALRHRGKAR